MIRLTFTVLCLLPAVVFAESDPWKKAIQSASEAHDAGRYQEAKKLFEQAIEEAEAFPSKDLRRAETNIKLAGTLLELGEYLECEQLCLKAMEFLGKYHPEEKLQIAHVESVLTKLYLDLNLRHLAEQHCENGLKNVEDAQGEERLDLAEFYALMRLVWSIEGSGGESQGGERAKTILNGKAKKNDPRWIIVYRALASDCYDRWEPEQARRAVSVAETVYGKQHPRYAECLSTLATAYRHKQKFDQSEQLSKQAIQILSKSLGPDHPKLAEAYRNLATIEQSRGHSAQAVSHLRESIRQRFATLSDTDLCYFFDPVVKSELRSHHHDRKLVEMYLSELARRGGDVIEDYLTRTVNAMQHNRQLAERSLEQLEKAPVDDAKLWFKLTDRIELESDNLEILTALRRVQHKPDPLKIFVKVHDREVSCVFPDFPLLEVAIRNVDVEQREVGFTEGGNYRSGRQARWRIDVTDANGRVYQPTQLFDDGLGAGGGLSFPTTLVAGKGWQTGLAMKSFVDTLPPGEYQMRIGYHNQLTIVDYEFTEGLIVSRSDPIKLIVKPRQITVTNKQQQKIDEILKQFDDKQPVKVVAGTYGEWAHELVKPDSQYGRLLALDWSAVPSLLNELKRDQQTPERRAHLLALLFSITGEHNPTGGGRMLVKISSNAIGNYSGIWTGWNVWGQREGKMGGAGGFEDPFGPTHCEGKLDPKKQEPFLKKWQEFSQHLKVVHED